MIPLILSVLVTGALILDALLRPYREPASRIAWIVVLLAAPFLGVIAYLLFGRVSIGRKKIATLSNIERSMPPLIRPDQTTGNLRAEFPDEFAHLFQLGRSINGFDPIGGNAGSLMADSNAAIDRMIEDIDQAEQHVHLLFYIWLTDNNGCKMVDALIRAAQRGIRCRALADDLGSRTMIRSEYWSAMKAAGVDVRAALPISNPLLRPFSGRIDLRNHRKILIIDNKITYCGSQNCADPEFRVKPKFAPWVDIMLRFEGPIASQNQRLFATDWMLTTGEDLSELLKLDPTAKAVGFPAQVIGTGPTVRYSAMPEMFASLMYAARRELVISSPYYVPNEQIQRALCAAAHRGVDTRVIFPARNDSFEVSAVSRSYYSSLLDAGVVILEYVGGLLHAKTLTIDRELALVGSANLDRRSFDLNYENNILFWDPPLTQAVRERQQAYINASQQVESSAVNSWSAGRRIVNNAMAMFSPLL